MTTKISKTEFEELENDCMEACEKIMPTLCALFAVSQEMVQYRDIDPYYSHELNVLVGASFALLHAINITFPGDNKNERQTCDNSETTQIS